ncbi:MAG: hypothetical protein HFJ12_01485 [Bacilli bacterium]|nr:hypothetical protein [Bacilli bacterium]
MYKVKIYNEHQMGAMLNSGKMQFENFYKDELITFLKFSINENKRLKHDKENLIKYLEDKIKETKEHKEFIYKNYDIFNNELPKKSFDEDILLIRKYKDILERVKSGKYE